MEPAGIEINIKYWILWAIAMCITPVLFGVSFATGSQAAKAILSFMGGITIWIACYSYYRARRDKDYKDGVFQGECNIINKHSLENMVLRAENDRLKAIVSKMNEIGNK